MTLGDKLSGLRRECNHTQEQLAQILGVSRQAVSRWESNRAYPETEKLIRIAELYGCTMDYLLKDGEREVPPSPKFSLRQLCFERKSQTTINGIPLWHINIGLGRTAKGIFAVGLVAKGLVSVGVCAMGMVTFGTLSLGLLAFGALAVGLVAAGAISLGLIAFGAVSIGILAVGAVALGQFSIGALAVGNYAASGDIARAAIAIGRTEATGSLYQTLLPPDQWQLQAITGLMDDRVPGILAWAKELFLAFLV